VLHPDEVDDETIVCNGVDGLTALSETTELPVGSAECALGGHRLDTGLDDNRDGELSADEIDSTTTLCAPKAEVGGWGGGGCASGGADLGLLAGLGFALSRLFARLRGRA